MSVESGVGRGVLRTLFPLVRVLLSLDFFPFFITFFLCFFKFSRVWHAVNQKMRQHHSQHERDNEKNLFTFDVVRCYCTFVLALLMGSREQVDTKVKRSRKKLKNTLWIIYFVIISKRMKEICAPFAPPSPICAFAADAAWRHTDVC